MSLSETHLSDEIIIKAEIDAYKQYFEEQQGTMKTIVLDAAQKLANSSKYNHDLSIICSRLYKAFPNLSQSYIRQVLPVNYKREYSKNEELTQPNSLWQEIMLRSADIQEEFAKLSMDIFKKMKTDPKIEYLLQEAFTKSGLLLQSKKFATISDLLDWIKETECHLAIAKDDSDFRVKLDIWTKTRLAIDLITINTRTVAKHLVTTKWLNMIEDSGEIAGKLERLKNCPLCEQSIFTYYKENQYRADHNLPPLSPKEIDTILNLPHP
jgi:hypothetical protein